MDCGHTFVFRRRLGGELLGALLNMTWDVNVKHDEDKKLPSDIDAALQWMKVAGEIASETNEPELVWRNCQWMLTHHLTQVRRGKVDN